MTVPSLTSATFRMSLFGPLQILVDGRPIPRLRSRKGQWLLALLTLRHDRPVERDWLAATLWPDVDQSQAFANLRPILSELRHALGSQAQRLQAPDRHTLFLDLTHAQVDVLTFDTAIATHNLSALEQAVALYGGPLLEGCNEEWVHQERNAREQQCLQALQTLAQAALRSGDYTTAAGYYQRAVRIDGLWETARRGWMEALATSGDRNAALQVYREFVELLKSDPSAVPDEKTSQLYLRLRAEARHQANPYTSTHALVAEKAIVPVVSGYLPHSLTELVGREDERLEVAEKLRHSRMVTLTGVGGIGKTRLALEVAKEVSREYADGVWLISLEALTEGRLVTRQIASVLEVKEEPGRPLLQSVTEYLRAKRMLLVLDNCEHLMKASVQVTGHLLQECAGVRVLATSREALGITGETAWMVPSLAVPDTKHLPEGQATLLRVLMSYESVQLFVERAQAVQKTFNLTGSNARTVAQICAQLEGIPLAIELAAARIKAMTVEQIAARLENELGLLTGGSRTAQYRQQTLRAALDWSYDLLNAPERRLLSRLSVFAGGCTLEAAEQVCGGEGIETGQVLDLLSSLVDKSLVVFEDREPEASGRYRLCEMVRQYAGERLQESGVVEQIKARHRDWFMTLAVESSLQMRGAQEETSLRRLETEHENLRAALTWCKAEENGAEAELRLVGALGRFWEVRGYPTEGRRYLAEALRREEATGRTPERARALSWAGVLAWRQGDYAEARSLHEQSLAISRELGDKQGIVWSLHELGNVVHFQGSDEAARKLHHEALATSRELGDKQGIADSLDNMGNMAREQGDYEMARAFYEECLAISRELRNKGGIAWSLNQLANVADAQGDYVEARSLHEQSLAISRELGDKWGIAWSLNNLGNVTREQGEHEAAAVLHEESLAISRELGDMRGVAWSLHSLSKVAYDQGEYAKARALFEESLNIHRGLGDKIGVAENLEGLAAVTLAQAEIQANNCQFP